MCCFPSGRALKAWNTDHVPLPIILTCHAFQGSQCAAFLQEELPKRIQTMSPITSSNLTKMALAIDSDFLRGGNAQAGSTAILAFVSKDEDDDNDTYSILTANVGDSRCLLWRNHDEQKCIPLSEEHSVKRLGMFSEDGERIRKAGGSVDNNYVCACRGKYLPAVNMYRAFGDLPFKQNPKFDVEHQVLVPIPDYDSCSASRHDFLLLSSDGLFEHCTSEVAMEFLSKQLEQYCQGDPARALLRLCDHIVNQGTQDNVTMILVVLDDGTGYGRPPEYIVGPAPTYSGNLIEAFFKESKVCIE